MKSSKFGIQTWKALEEEETTVTIHLTPTLPFLSLLLCFGHGFYLVLEDKRSSPNWAILVQMIKPNVRRFRWADPQNCGIKQRDACGIEISALEE